MSVLAGRKVVVVGASSGIGRAVATAASAEGAAVAFAARRADRLESAVRAAGGGHAVTMDVTDERSVVAATRQIVDHFGGTIDLLVYAAGMSPLGEVSTLSADQWRRVLDTNVVGAALVARELLPALTERGAAAFVSSIAVGRPRRALVSYSASKAALDELVLGLRAEHPDRRLLRVVVGDTVGTEFGEAFDAEVMSDALRHWVAEAHLYRRQMSADDLGAAIVEVLGTVLAHPEIDLSDVRLEPPGGPLTVDPDSDVLAAFELD